MWAEPTVLGVVAGLPRSAVLAGVEEGGRIGRLDWLHLLLRTFLKCTSLSPALLCPFCGHPPSLPGVLGGTVGRVSLF